MTPTTSIRTTATRAPLAPAILSAIEALLNTEVSVSTPTLEVGTTIRRLISDTVSGACPEAGTVLAAFGLHLSRENCGLVILRDSAEFADAFPQGLHDLPSSFTI
jgi:hypothetical protein